MKLEVLYFDGCPTYHMANEILEGLLAEEGIAAEIRMIAVNTDEEAERLRFPGSPTIRADGRDLFPTGERENWRLGCRIYSTPEGLKGYPTAEMVKEALTTEGGVDAAQHYA